MSSTHFTTSGICIPLKPAAPEWALAFFKRAINSCLNTKVHSNNENQKQIRCSLNNLLPDFLHNYCFIFSTLLHIINNYYPCEISYVEARKALLKTILKTSSCEQVSREVLASDTLLTIFTLIMHM